MRKLIETTCPICQSNEDIVVNYDEWAKYQAGALIQDALVSLNADQREQIITGICKPCWDASFGEEE